MAGSPAEREIRDAVVAFLHAQLPQARVIHELVVGGCRADIAAVERQRVILFEIKSERDTLARLGEQMRQFSRAGHITIAVLHECWFDRMPHPADGSPRMDFARPEDWRHDWHPNEVWAYPEPPPKSPGSWYRWSLPRPNLTQPRASHLLGLLWRDELRYEAGRHRIAIHARATIRDIIDQMTWLMTGREIAEAVCRQLRMRNFPEADAPICDEGGEVDRSADSRNEIQRVLI